MEKSRHFIKITLSPVTRQELLEALGMAIYMGGGPSLMYAADALPAFEQSTLA